MSTASSEPPIALRIPPELWVLVSEELEYIDLKRLSGVCKAFKAIFEHPRYKLRLFLSPPTGQLQPKTHLAIHPMLESLDLIRSKDVDTAEFLHPHQHLNAFDYPAADDFATAPACTKIKIVMNDEHECGTVTCPSGVTVRQVMKRILEYWNAPVTDKVAAAVRKEFNMRKNYPVIQRTWSNWMEFDLYDGWKYAKVKADGVTVLLASNHFYR